MPFKDFETKPRILQPSESVVEYTSLTTDAVELYDMICTDLAIAKKKHTIHSVSARWMARATGLGFPQAAKAMDELLNLGYLIEDGDTILVASVRNYPYSTPCCKKACQIKWMRQNIGDYLESLPKAVGKEIYSNRIKLRNAFMRHPFWLYACCAAVWEYTMAVKKEKSSNWFGLTMDAKEKTDEVFGDFNSAFRTYFALFEEMRSVDEWDIVFADEFSYPFEPNFTGAVAKFYQASAAGYICPDARTVNLFTKEVKHVPKKLSASEAEMERFRNMQRELVEKSPQDLTGIDEYVGVSARILEYVEKHPDMVFSSLVGAPYETIHREVLSCLNDWQYYDDETKAKVSNMIQTVATPCLKKHFSKVTASPRLKADAAIAAITELYGDSGEDEGPTVIPEGESANG